MVKLEQALILDPASELHFTPPFTDITTAYLKLVNPTDRNIAFKLKTTAPKTYCVRPNSGIVYSKTDVTVAVMLQPLSIENLENMKHKFMVQSLFCPDGEVDQGILWREASSDSLMNSKLKCVFDIPQPTRSQAEGGDNASDIVDSRNEDIGSASDVTAEGKENVTKSGETELQKAKHMNKRLQELLKELRTENAVLKEGHLRLRRTKAASGTSESVSGPSNSQAMAMAAEPNSMFKMYFLVIFIIVLAIGILLGKKL